MNGLLWFINEKRSVLISIKQITSIDIDQTSIVIHTPSDYYQISQSTEDRKIYYYEPADKFTEDYLSQLKERILPKN